MASTRLELTSTEQSNNLATAIDNLRNARDRINHAKAVMETCIDGTNYALVEELFGVPAGSGETLYNLIAGVASDLAGFNTAATIARLG